MVEGFPLQNNRGTSSSRRLQLLASFERVLGIALSIPVLVVILKPPPFIPTFQRAHST